MTTTKADSRWPEEKVLSEARRRTKELNADNTDKVRHMLADLVKEAGWTDEEFLDAMCQDVIRKGDRRGRSRNAC